MWTLGKIYQRLGDQSESLRWFLLAYEANPTQPDVAREAGLAALDSGHHADAACLFTAALRASPTDWGLHANLALAYLLTGRLEDARTHAELAFDRAPSDEVSANVLRLVREIQTGARPQPKSVADLR
jgi:Flp pilus assembly protein TadD